MIQFRPQERPILPAVDLGIVQNTLSTITAGNKEALQTQSNLRTAIANMDLNEAEDGFRDNLYNEITKTIEDNAIAGNAYYALDDIIKKQGDIASNPGLMGRLKAQKAYKEYQAQIDARNDINLDTKAWAKELNPYSYQDKVDKDGKVVGGTEWSAGFTPVSDIDFNAVFDAVAKQLHPQKSSWSGTSTWLYDDGTTGNKFIPDKTTAAYSDSSGSYERITEKMIRDAINSAFQNNPQLAAGAKQAFDVLNWKADKGELVSEFEQGIPYNGAGGLFTPSGRRKTYNEYMMDMVDDYAKTHAYNYTHSSTNYRDAAIKAQYAAKQGASNGNGSNRILDDIIKRASDAGQYEAKISDFGVTSANYNETSANVLNQLANIGIKLDKLPDTPEDLRNIIANTQGLSDTNRQVAGAVANYYQDQYDKYRPDWDALKNARSAEGTKADAAADISTMLTQGQSLDTIADTENPHLKKYITKYNDIINRTFGSNDQIAFVAKSEAAANKLFDKVGGKSQLEDLGFTISGNKIYVPKEKAELLNNLVHYASGIKGNYIGISNGKEQELTRGFWGALAANSNGTYGATISRNNNYIVPRNIFEKPFENFNRSLRSAINEESNKQLSFGDQNFYVPIQHITGANPSEITNRALLEMTGEPGYERMAKQAAASFNNVRAGEYGDKGIKIKRDGSSSFVNVDGAERNDILSELKFRKKFEVYEPYVAPIDGLGLRHGLRYSYINDKKELIKRDIVLDYYEDDPDMIMYNQSPNIVNQNYIINHWINDQPVTLGKVNGILLDAVPNKTSIDNNLQWIVTYNGTAKDNNNIILNNKEVNEISLAWQKLVNDRNVDEEVDAITYINNLVDTYPALELLFNSPDDLASFVIQGLSR